LSEMVLSLFLSLLFFPRSLSLFFSLFLSNLERLENDNFSSQLLRARHTRSTSIQYNKLP
jgi:hypothetical protein